MRAVASAAVFASSATSAAVAPAAAVAALALRSFRPPRICACTMRRPPPSGFAAAAFEADRWCRFRLIPTHLREVATCPDTLLLRAAHCMERRNGLGRMPMCVWHTVRWPSWCRSAYTNPATSPAPSSGASPTATDILIVLRSVQNNIRASVFVRARMTARRVVSSRWPSTKASAACRWRLRRCCIR